MTPFYLARLLFALTLAAVRAIFVVVKIVIDGVVLLRVLARRIGAAPIIVFDVVSGIVLFHGAT
jgi:hypothetical protein